MRLATFPLRAGLLALLLALGLLWGLAAPSQAATKAVRFKTSAKAEQAVARELKKVGVRFAAPKGHEGPVVGGRVTLTPNDPFYLQSLYRFAFDASLFPSAWSLTTGSPQTVIAVVDTGVDPNAPDLQGALLPGYDFVNGDSDPSDDEGHGTMMASLAAARINNGIGIAGACGGCAILPVKVADSRGNAPWTTVAAGIIWAADHGARVISVSLAGSAASPTLIDAVSYAQSKGAVVVAAAGNDSLLGPEYPAALPGVVSVEAVDQSGNPYPFSNHGPQVTLAAGGCATALGMNNVYYNVCGTSTSTPIVSGALGLLFSYQPSLSAAQAVTAIEQSGQRVSDSQYGRLDVFDALKSLIAVPASLSAPTVSGSPLRGAVLTANPGSWSGGQASYAYQWLRCPAGATSGPTDGCVAIAEATSQSYTVQSADLGKTLRVSVTAENASGQAQAVSDGVGVPMPQLLTKPKAKVKPKAKHKVRVKASARRRG